VTSNRKRMSKEIPKAWHTRKHAKILLLFSYQKIYATGTNNTEQKNFSHKQKISTQSYCSAFHNQG